MNRPPVFTTTAPTSATVGQLLRYDARASDPDGDPLTFDLVVRPDGMAVQSATGTLVWVPTADQVGSHDVILRVRDGRGGVALQSFQVLVGRANTGPVITSVPTGPAVVGLLYQYQVRAQDADGDPITFSLAAGPAGMAIDPVTGLLTWTPAADQVGSQHVAVTADDGLGASTTQSFDLPVVATAPNDPPAITSTPRTSIRQGDRYLYAVAASDPNGDPLTFSLTAAPAGMTIDGAGLVTWDPAPDQFGPNAVTVRVEDGRGGFATQSFTVNVVAQGSNRPPSITSTPPQAATVGREYVYDAVASDPDGDPLAWSLDVSPAGMSIDPTAGTIRWTPTADQVGLQDLVVRVVDGQGGFATQSYAVAVRSVNLPPMITSAPVTRAAVGEGYAYAVRATDPDGDPLSFTLTAAPAGMTIDGAGLILWTPDVGQVGPHDVAVRVEDGQGGVATQTYTVEVSATAANEPPVITSTPPFSATAGVLYTYQVTAEDPDGDPVLFSLLAGPEGMSLDPTTGLLTWTPTLAQVGFQDVVVAAIDPSGAGGTQSFTVAVSDGNNAPTITSSPVQVVTAGLPYRYDVQASDPDDDPITFTVDAGPAGLAIDAFGRVTWAPGVADVGVHRVEITVADDRGAFVTQAYDLAVLADGQTPRVSLFVSANPAQLGTPVTFAVSATDNVGVETLGLTIDGNPVPLDGQGRITLLAEPVGEYAIVASATDAAGNTGLASTTLLVIDTSDTQAPVVEITAPAADAVLTAPTDVTGTASDDNLLYYTLSVAPVAGGDFVEVFRGDTSVTDGVLGLLDTSTLANDAYILRLSATDAGGNTSFIDTTINVAGDLKVGNFTLSFTDLTVPVSGIPITVSRTYDSLNAGTANELGYGWRLEFRDTDLRTGLLPSGAEQLGIYTPFRDGVHVYVTLPGGRREGFTFQAVPVSGFAGSFGFYNPTFVADAGVTSRLSVPNFTLVRNEFGEYYGVVAGGSLAYNPADTLNFGGVYFLTTREGIAYEIDANTGDLRTVRDSNGNVLTFTDDAITSNRGPQVTFERDPQGRIVAAIDPAGDRVRYAYDAAGDLVSVTDREDNVTTFVYDQPGRPHYLTEVIDPLGRTGVRTEYDDAGRLVTLIDADGHAVSLAHDPDNSVETVTDALGNTTTFEYDARGNVVTEVDALGGITRRTYDGANNMLTETDPLGHTTTFTYDGSGNVLTETDPLGHTTTFTYRAFVPGLFASVQGARTTTRLATTTDPLGNTTTNAYDGAGNLLSTTDALGNTTRFTYDDRGNQTSITDALDNVTTFEYDGAGNLTRQVDPLLHETTFTYDGNGNQLTETTTLTTPAGVVDVVTTTTYDGNGRPLTVTDAEDNTTRTEYDALGNQQATVDALGRRTEFTYDDRGQLTTILFADGTTTGIGYDELGRRTSTTDRAGRVTRFEYDPLGRLVKTIFPDDTPDDPDDNPFTRTEYDDAGRVTAQFDELGHATRFEYDDAGRQVVVRDALGNETVTTYDDAGRVTASTDALGRTTTFVVDALGRTTDTLFVDGTTMGTVYDDLGRVVSQTDQASRTTRFEYDDAGRLTAVVDPLDQRTEYGYDEAGDLTSQTDANDHTTTFEYDRVGRRTATVLPLGQRATTAYDPAGNVASTTDFNGATITFDYDDNNRLLFQHFEDGSTVGFTYTPTGQRETVTDGRGVTFYAYDERDRLASRTDPDGTAISYTYDDAGRRTSVTTPAGTTGYTFDLLGRQETVTDPADGVTRYSYDAVGNLVRTERPDGSVETRDYDDLGRLTFLEDRDGSGDVISSYDYTLSPTGRRDAVVEADGRRVDYEYDPLDRLMREAISDAVFGDRTFDYTYDPVGNRLTRLDSLEGLTAYTYDDNDRLLTETTGGVETAYGYDANGNTLSKVTGADRVSYTWDDQNRLVAADTDGDGSDDVQYQYDADGLRVAEVAGGEETRFLVDTNLPFAQVLLEYRPSGLVVASYVHGLDLIAQTRGGATSFYHVDGLGSTRALTDAAGAVTDTYAYEAFGRTVGQTGATPNVYLFAGEQRDFNVGLDYLRARYLDTGTGRFYGMDPFQGFQQQPMSLHRFLYANTNPANNIDPSGKIGIVAAIAASILQAELSLISQTAFGGLRIRVAEDFAGNLLKPAFEARDESLLRIADGTGGKVAFAVFTTSTTIISQGFVLFALGLKRISAAESKVNLGLSFLTINPTIKDLGEHILDQITPTPSSVAGSLAALAFDNLISALDQSFTLTDVMRRIDTTSSALDNLIAIEVDQGIINSLILTKKSLTALGNLAKIAN